MDQATQLWDEIRRNQTAAPAVDPHDIEACEALLESYYMQVRFWLNQSLLATCPYQWIAFHLCMLSGSSRCLALSLSLPNSS